VAALTLIEIRDRVLGPLVGLGEQHLVLEISVDVPPKLADEGVGLGQVLAVGPLLFVEVGDGIEPEAVDAQPEPEVDGAKERLLHGRIFEIEIGLVRIESVPKIGFRDRIPSPVRGLEVLEDDARFLVPVRRVAPYVEVAVARSLRRRARPLEPRVLIGRVVQDELGDDAQPSLVRLAQEQLEVLHRAAVGVHVEVIGGVVTVVFHRRRIEGEEPERRDAELLEVVELFGEPGKVADAVAVRVVERPHTKLVEDGVLVPERLVG
jgi:hypothetical protein